MQARLKPRVQSCMFASRGRHSCQSRCWLKHRVTPSKGKKQLLRSEGMTYISISSTSRSTRSRNLIDPIPTLRLSAVCSSLGRKVVLQPTAQELLLYNLQPNLALQSLTGGWLNVVHLHWLRRTAPLALLPVDWTGVNGSGVKNSNRSNVAEQH